MPLCARHGKMRSRQYLKKTEQGYVCNNGDECKGADRSKAMEKGLCSLHGKSRLASKLQKLSDGTMVCLPKSECRGHIKKSTFNDLPSPSKELSHNPRSTLSNAKVNEGYHLRPSEFPALKSQSKIRPIVLKIKIKSSQPPLQPSPKSPFQEGTKSLSPMETGVLQSPALNDHEISVWSTHTHSESSSLERSSQDQTSPILQEPRAEYSLWSFETTNCMPFWSYASIAQSKAINPLT